MSKFLKYLYHIPLIVKDAKLHILQSCIFCKVASAVDFRKQILLVLYPAQKRCRLTKDCNAVVLTRLHFHSFSLSANVKQI